MDGGTAEENIWDDNVEGGGNPINKILPYMPRLLMCSRSSDVYQAFLPPAGVRSLL